MYSKIYKANAAKEFLPDLIATDKAIVISPILDSIVTGDYLGHLIVFPGMQIIWDRGKLTGKAFTITQIESGFKGSFALIGVNSTYFHHLLNNKITGKYTSNNAFLDRQFNGAFSYELVSIIKTNIKESLYV